jgi:hypothetical protein
MHSSPSNQLGPFEIRAWTARIPTGEELVSQLAAGGVERLPLPRQQVGQLRRGLREDGAGRDQHSALGAAVRDVAGRARTEEVVELLLRHRLEGGDVCDLSHRRSRRPRATRA